MQNWYPLKHPNFLVVLYLLKNYIMQTCHFVTKKFVPLDTFQFSNALILVKDLQSLNIFPKLVLFDIFQFSNALIFTKDLQPLKIFAKFVPFEIFQLSSGLIFTKDRQFLTYY